MCNSGRGILVFYFVTTELRTWHQCTSVVVVIAITHWVGHWIATLGA